MDGHDGEESATVCLEKNICFIDNNFKTLTFLTPSFVKIS